MTLADATNGRVATHLPQGLDVVAEQQSLATHAGRREGSFGAGMATADNDDIKFLWIEHGRILRVAPLFGSFQARAPHNSRSGKDTISMRPYPMLSTPAWANAFNSLDKVCRVMPSIMASAS